MIASPDKFNWATIIWAGRNNYSDSASVVNDIAQMVDSLDHDNYIVLGIINGNYAAEFSGGGNYSKIININNYLSSTYGDRYVPIREYLVSLYNSDSAQDVTDHSNDIVPASLRGDNIHLNKAGYDTVARYIFDNYIQFLTYDPGDVLYKYRDLYNGNVNGAFKGSLAVRDFYNNDAVDIDAVGKKTTIYSSGRFSDTATNIVTNGSFDDGMTGWTGTNWSDGGGKATHTPGSASPLTQSITYTEYNRLCVVHVSRRDINGEGGWWRICCYWRRGDK